MSRPQLPYAQLSGVFGAVRVGAKVIEMADRLNDVAAAMPGSQAIWFFELDDRRYKVVLTVGEPV